MKQLPPPEAYTGTLDNSSPLLHSVMNSSLCRNAHACLAMALLLIVSTSVIAKQVGVDVARRVASAQFNSMRTEMPRALQTSEFILAYDDRVPLAPGDTVTAYYVFNAPAGGGFVIVAGDNAVVPVLGYSTEGSYTGMNIPPAFAWWMHNYEREIVAAIEHHAEGSSEVHAAWSRLGNSEFFPLTPRVQASRPFVVPMIRTEWNQSPYYNDMCPFDKGENKRSVTGCVATSFAQIMKYYEWPAKGIGDHGYTSKRYGYLYVNFANAQYKWGSMPEAIDGPNSAIAQIMYHVGVAIDMDYSPSGSSGWPDSAARALRRYFSYKATAKNLERAPYSDAEWLALILTELDNARPIEYHGYGDGSGHSFVCDGYVEPGVLPVYMFHMNWGWAGAGNGFFEVNHLTPSDVGTGGGSGSYNDDQGIVIGIEPADGVDPGSGLLSMNAPLLVSPNPVAANGRVTITFDIINEASETFAGDFAVALFDASSYFVKMMGGVLANRQLEPQAHVPGGITIVDTLFGLAPGDYTLAVFARPTGMEWSIVDAGSFQSSTILTVTEPNYAGQIYQYSLPSVSPPLLHRGEQLTIHADFGNRSTQAFFGDFSVWLYQTDGTKIGVIDSLNDVSLQANAHTTNGVLFSSNGLDVPPGRYALVFYSRVAPAFPFPGGDWEFVSTGSYVNPLIIDVVEPLIVGDRYEMNDSASVAYPFTLPFTDDAAAINTAGSNIHVREDLDFYRVDLPDGYQYTVVATLHDSRTDNPGDFTNDVSVMWNTGDGWSKIFNQSTGKIVAAGGKAITFKVQPMFTGLVGTYRLDIVATRATTAVHDALSPAQPRIVASPLPADNELLVNMSGVRGGIRSIRLIDEVGRSSSARIIGAASDQVRLDVSALAAGSYTVVVETALGSSSQRIIVRR
jgi:hypothetical protein